MEMALWLVGSLAAWFILGIIGTRLAYFVDAKLGVEKNESNVSPLMIFSGPIIFIAVVLTLVVLYCCIFILGLWGLMKGLAGCK